VPLGKNHSVHPLNLVGPRIGEEAILAHLNIEPVLFGRPVRRLFIIVTVIPA
jgi:hypothetical protein